MSGNDEPPLDLADNLSDNDEPSLDLADNLSDNDEPLPDLGGEDILSHPSVKSGDDGGDTGSLSIDAECGYVMKDSTVSKVDYVQSSNDNRLDSSIKNDTNCFTKKKSYNNSNVKKNLNDLHDSKKGDNDLSGRKEKDQNQSKKNQSNPKVKYTYSTGHDDIKGSLPENALKFIDFDDCWIVSDNDAMDLKSIMLCFLWFY